MFLILLLSLEKDDGPFLSSFSLLSSMEIVDCNDSGSDRPQCMPSDALASAGGMSGDTGLGSGGAVAAGAGTCGVSSTGRRINGTIGGGCSVCKEWAVRARRGSDAGMRYILIDVGVVTGGNAATDAAAVGGDVFVVVDSGLWWRTDDNNETDARYVATTPTVVVDDGDDVAVVGVVRGVETGRCRFGVCQWRGQWHRRRSVRRRWRHGLRGDGGGEWGRSRGMIRGIVMIVVIVWGWTVDNR